LTVIDRKCETWRIIILFLAYCDDNIGYRKTRFCKPEVDRLRIGGAVEHVGTC